MSEKLLSIGERLYRTGLRVIQFAFRRGILKVYRMPVSVISVGNLTWGGTGKTPLVIFLARALQRRGHQVAVLTRGYGQDEPRLLERHLGPIPVLVGADRVAVAAGALIRRRSTAAVPMAATDPAPCP